VVELTAAGQVLREPLTVLPDPRVKVTQADFESQFRLAKQIEAQRIRVRTMLKEATSLKLGLPKIAGQTDAAALDAQYATLVGPEPPIQGVNAPNTLTGISSWLDKLAKAVDGADGGPTPDALRGFAQIKAALDSIEPRWRAFEMAVQPRIVASR
jgi:hypothetical protein